MNHNTIIIDIDTLPACIFKPCLRRKMNKSSQDKTFSSLSGNAGSTGNRHISVSIIPIMAICISHTVNAMVALSFIQNTFGLHDVNND